MDHADFDGEGIRARRLDRRRQQPEHRREKRSKRFQGSSTASRSWCLDGHGFGQSLLIIAVDARARLRHSPEWGRADAKPVEDPVP
jgi:hypothetical protein